MSLYAGVLDLATQKGLVKLEVDLIQFPSNENGMEAVCRATAVSKIGSVYTDFGDANPENCTELVSKHIIRVASTRAKGRALRDMCNIGIACLEELGDFDDIIPDNRPQSAAKKPAQRPAAKKPDRKTPVQKPAPTPAKTRNDRQNNNQPRISEAQKRAIYNLGNRRKLDKEAIEKEVLELFGLSIDDISSSNAGLFIKQLQTA